MSRVNGKKVPVTPLQPAKSKQLQESPPLTVTTPVVINTGVGALEIGSEKKKSPSLPTIFNAAGKPGVHPTTHENAKLRAGIRSLASEFNGMPINGITKGRIGNNNNEQGGGRRNNKSKRRQTKKQIKRRRQTRRR